MSELRSDMPKNLPEDMGRDKNIAVMSESSGDRGDVSSKIGIGMDACFEGGGRRRHPRSHGLLKGLLAYFSAALLILGTLTVVSWRLAEMREEGRAELFLEKLLEESELSAWQQMLRLNLPVTYPAYEDASRLAYDVLAPALEIGDITYMRRMLPSEEGYPIFELFSDGEHFAAIIIKNSSMGLFSTGEWSVERIEFDIDYFDEVSFPELRVILPAGAELSVNGVRIDSKAKESYCVSYPELSPAERGHSVAPCDIYIFDDIYFQPELGASLNGEALTLCEARDNTFCFRYPESATHSIKVTVPVGVDAYVGGILLTEEWASRIETEGELGSLDDGGTGTLPRLSVWTVDDLFGEVEVNAKIGDKEVALLSRENGNYRFETPDECKYTLTVILPVGAELFVNGKLIAAEAKVDGGATAEDIADGFTALGRYEVSELGVIEGAVPSFDKYVLAGYLAEPKVTARLGESELEAAGTARAGYAVRYDFDFSAGNAFDAERRASAESFAKAYIAYVCNGGAWNDPDNAKAFKANYDALKAQMIEGTTGYVAVMESYREVNMMHKYDSYSIESLSSSELVAYTEKSLSSRVDFSVNRTRRIDGAEQTDTLTGSISVLQVLYKGEWRVWSFVYAPVTAE